MVTLRAHGDSTGAYNDAGYSARHDVTAAVTWLRAQAAARPLVVWGQSIGGVAAVLAAAANRDSVDGYILECVYQDLATAVRNRLDIYLPNWCAAVAYSGMRLVAPFSVPYFADTSPVNAAPNIPADVPVLLLAGGRDDRAHVRESEAIASRIPGETQVVIIPAGGHLDLLVTDPQAYFAAVETLLDRVAALSPARQR
jgi:uncharacterized protein